MAVSLRFIPGSTIRWRERRFVVVDYAGMDAIVAREVGKRRLQRIPVNQAITDLTPGDRDAWTPDLVSVPEEAWQTAVRRFKILRPLFEIGHTERTFAKVSKIAAALGKHPSTIYRWIEDYERAERLSVFLRKERDVAFDIPNAPANLNATSTNIVAWTFTWFETIKVSGSNKNSIPGPYRQIVASYQQPTKHLLSMISGLDCGLRSFSQTESPPPANAAVLFKIRFASVLASTA